MAGTPAARLPVRRRRADALGLLAGVLADTALGDPRRAHPVSGFGSAAGALQRRLERDSRPAGIVFAATALAAVAVPAGVGSRLLGSRVSARVGLTAWATWAALGGTTLAREAATMTAMLEADDVPAARRRLGHLCSRDASGLQAGELARATVESVAENTSDAVVGPLLWGALLGVPGLLGYRAVNTLDAMVGYRDDRFRRFGWASARLDDLANLVPARLTAVLALALAPLVGGRPSAGLRAWRRDARTHPSPNAGPVEAAFAGSLGVRLGGPTRYRHGVEARPVLAPEGRAVVLHDVRRAVRLSRAVGAVAAAAAVGLRWLNPLGARSASGGQGADGRLHVPAAPWRVRSPGARPGGRTATAPVDRPRRAVAA